MGLTERLRWAAVAAVAALLALSPFRLAAQDARAILLEPGAVNASVDGTSWWLANHSITVTWSTAGGGIRLASVYDRLGGRTAPKPGEAFGITLPDGRVIQGSELKAVGPPAIVDLPAAPSPGGASDQSPGKQIVARFASTDGALRVRWRATLRAGEDLLRQDVSFEAGRGEAQVADIAMAGVGRAASPATSPAEVRILAGPYLQSPGPSSMSVMWITEANAAGWVEYGRQSSTPLRAIPVRDGLVDANTRVHRVTLNGLSPDTPYFYRIATRPILSFGPYKADYSEIVRSDALSFRTLGPSRQSFSFLVLNDLHEDVETMRAQMAKAAEQPYDLLFFNGDSLSHLEAERQIIDRCLKPASDLFARRTPFFLVRGNHETRGAFARDLGNYLALPDGRYYYSFDHGPVHFIVMDTGEDKEDGHWAYSGLTDFDAYRQQEAEWLAREVRSAAFTRARFRVLVAHMPFFGSQRTRVEGHGPADCRARWGAMLNNAGLDLHIAGHTHRPDWIEPASGANRFPIAVGGGSARGSNTLTRVNVSAHALEVVVTTDDGTQVSRHTVKARR
jgi:predicted phosphodiesterase